MLALVTCVAAADLDVDMPLLLAELEALDVAARAVAWDDPTVDWASFDAAILRSTWDYFDRYDEFMAWARSTARATRLLNPIDVIEWNTDKRYLAELESQGIPIVPSSFVVAGGEVPDWIDGDVVVKPTVGAGSNGVQRFRGDADGACRHILTLHARGVAVLVQPYQPAIDDQGETGMVYLNGAFSHAFGKSAILAGEIDFGPGLYAEERIVSRAASAAERALGDAVIATLPALAYARVDLLPGPEGPALLELELTEPSLFFASDPTAAGRAAAAFRSLIA